MASDRRSGLVRFLKVALPLAAVGLVSALFLSARTDLGRGISLSSIDFDVTDGLRLSEPRFTGATREGRPFAVTADWALPDGPDPERVGLGPVRGEMEVDEGRSVTLTAAGGEIHPKRKRLVLDGAVEALSSDGYRVRAVRAEVDLGEQTLVADGPVAVSGPAGDIAATSMRAARRDGAYVILFEGGVRLRADPARTQ